MQTVWSRLPVAQTQYGTAFLAFWTSKNHELIQKISLTKEDSQIYVQ